MPFTHLLSGVSPQPPPPLRETRICLPFHRNSTTEQIQRGERRRQLPFVTSHPFFVDFVRRLIMSLRHQLPSTRNYPLTQHLSCTARVRSAHPDAAGLPSTPSPRQLDGSIVAVEGAFRQRGHPTGPVGPLLVWPSGPPKTSGLHNYEQSRCDVPVSGACPTMSLGSHALTTPRSLAGRYRSRGAVRTRRCRVGARSGPRGTERRPRLSPPISSPVLRPLNG